MDFDCLTQRVSPKLKAIAHKLNGRFTFFDEDDLYQEALIHLWEGCQIGELTDKTDSYILQGCFFFLKNYIRVSFKRVDMQSVSLYNIVKGENEDDSLLSEMLVTEDSDKQFGFIVVDILVEDILSCLTEREKDVFLLSLDEMTTREIGDRLGVSHAMVVKVKKKIRSKCKAIEEEITDQSGGLPKG
tara:strand:+ start:664 stop:1224 length:561 start_codon:yes stop_codon:yes gene_type:complete